MNANDSAKTSLYRSLRLSVFYLGCKLELGWALLTGRTDWLLRKRFNRWARWGVGTDMEQIHLRMAQKTLKEMNLSPSQRILELGCGEGWASRLMAQMAGEDSRVVAMDIADEMVRCAKNKSVGMGNMSFVCGAAEYIPFQDSFFDVVLSIEAFYYIKNQDKALRELYRVMAPNGRLYLLIVFHKDNPESIHGVDELRIPLQFHSAAEYAAMLVRNGWAEVRTEVFELQSQPDGRPDVHDRPLLITGKKLSTGRQSLT